MLISTLIGLMVLASLTVAIQSRLLTSTKTLKSWSQGEMTRFEEAAARALARPLLVEAMIQFDAPSALTLDGRAFEIDVLGKPVTIRAQSTQGLVDIFASPVEVYERHLPGDLARLAQEMKRQGTLLPLRVRYLRSGGDFGEIAVPELWMTDSGASGDLVFPSVLYDGPRQRGVPTRQPNTAVIYIGD